jgi:hypothetical protein
MLRSVIVCIVLVLLAQPFFPARLSGRQLPVGARAAGRIVGCAFDDEGLVMPGVERTFNGEGVRQIQVTGSDGCYSATLLTGRYTISARLQAFVFQSREVTLRPGVPLLRFDFEGKVAPTAVREPPLMFLPAPPTATPETPGTLIGCVTDTEGQPLPGTDAFVVKDGGTVYRTVAAADGCFSLKLPSGRCRLTVKLGGFEDAVRERIDVRAGELRRYPALVLKLRPLSLLPRYCPGC